MGEKIRINGFEFYNLSRIDQMQQNKIERGMYANTIDLNKGEQKNKLTTIVNTDFQLNGFLEHTLTNPAYSISYIEGTPIPNQQLLTANRFKHSIGNLDYIDIDTYQFGTYSILTENTLNKKGNWNFLISEDFENFDAFTHNYDIVTSNGNEYQSKSIDWLTYYYSESVNLYALISNDYSVSGNKSLKLNNLTAIATQNLDYLTNFEYSFYGLHTSSSGLLQIIYSMHGTRYTDEYDIFGIIISFANNTAEWYHRTSYTGTYTALYHISLDDFITLTTETWYHFKIKVIGNNVSFYLNNEYIDSYDVYDYVGGNIGILNNYGYGYIDDLKVIQLPTYQTSSPMNSIVYNSENTFQTSGFFGTQYITKHSQNVDFLRDYGLDHVLFLDFNKKTNHKILDKSQYNNDGRLSNAEWIDGYIDNALKLENGFVYIEDDSSISDLDEFNLHMRFKLKDLDTTSRGLQLTPLVSNNNEFVIYDYKRTNELMLHYKFNNSLSDNSGFNIDANYYGTPTYQTGKISNGIYNTGYENHVEIDFNRIIDYDNPITISFWVKLRSLDAGGIFFTYGHASFTDRLYFGLYNGKFAIGYGSVGYSTGTFGSDVEIDTWYHLIYTYEKGKNKVYVNGQLEFSKILQIEVDPSLNTYGVTIGSYQRDTAYDIDTVIDDFRIYGRVLDENEISQLVVGTEDTLNYHRLAFEIYGELLLGDTIAENEWIEAWFLSDGKSSFIYRRDLTNQEIVAEARKTFGDLILYLPLDGDYEDESANEYSTTLTGSASYEDAKLDEGIKFSGQSDNYVDVDYANDITDDEKFTFSTWINVSSAWDRSSKDGDTIVFGVGSYNNSLGIVYSKTSEVLYIAFRDDSANITAISTQGFSDNVWYHVTGTIDFTTNKMSMYINGELKETETFTNDSFSTTDHWEIGGGRILSGNTIARYFEGQLDDARLYRRLLTEEEIKYLYAKPNYDGFYINSTGKTNFVDAGLSSYYPLNNSLSDNGFSDIDLTLSGTSAYTSGKINYSFDFNGSSYLYTKYLTMKDFSISGWVKFNSSSDGDYNYIFDIYSNTYGVRIYIYKHMNNNIVFNIQDSSSSYLYNMSSSNWEYDKWHHFGITYDGSRVIYYWDGVEFTNENIRLDICVIYLNNFTIGSHYGGSSYFLDGEIDDFRIYNHAVTSDFMYDVYTSVSEYNPSHKTYVNHFELKDKFIYPYRFENNMNQVKIWNIPDDISNDNYSHRIAQISTNYEDISQVKVKNIYDSNSYVKQNSTATYTTKTYSIFRDQSFSSYYWTTNNDFQDWFTQDYVTEMTISMWLYVEPNQANYIVSIDSSSDVFFKIYVTTKDANSYVTFYSDEGTHVTNFRLEHIAKWFKLDVVFDNGKIYIYQNGVLTRYRDASDVILHYSKYLNNTTKVAHWFTGDDVLTDEIGDVTLSAINSAGFDDGKYDSAFKIVDTTNEYFSGTLTGSLDNLSEYTAEFWAKITSTPVDYNDFLMVTKSTGSSRTIGFFATSDPKLFFGFYDDNIGNYAQISITSSETDFFDGNWHHVAGTWDGSTLKLYIDGTLLKSGTFSGYKPSQSATLIKIGDDDWDGYIDEVIISKVAKTTFDINRTSINAIKKDAGALKIGYTNNHFNDLVIYDVALTKEEIEKQFINDPFVNYLNNTEVVSIRQQTDNDIFIENGLIGVKLHKAKPVSAKKEQGGLDIRIFDKGWENVGRLFMEDQES